MGQDAQEQLAEAIVALVEPRLERMIEQAIERRLPEPSPWLSTNEAASYLDTTPQAIRNRVHAGTLRAHKDSGHKLKFTRADLDASVRRKL